MRKISPGICYAMLLFTFLGVAGCDSPINQPEEEAAISLKQAPITYVKPGVVQNKGYQPANPAPYYCLASTLNPTIGEWAYRNQRFDVTIPGGLVKKAKKQGLDGKWVTFRFGDLRATTRANVDTLGDGALLRMAKCRLPATQQVLDKVEQQLTKFDQYSWAYQMRPDSSSNEDNTEDSGPSLVPTGLEYQCTAVIDYYICNDPNATNLDTNPGCTYISTTCVEWGFVYVEDSQPGGGGTNSGDPCAPCAPDMPCSNQEGGGLGSTPQGCGVHVDHDSEILDPCETGNAKIDDIELKLKELWDNSNVEDQDISQRKEQGGWIVDTGDGFRLEPFPPDWDYTACSINSPPNISLPANTVGSVHTHPYKVGDDIASICQQDKKTIYEGRASIADIQNQRKFTQEALAQGSVENPTDFTTLVVDEDGIRETNGFFGFFPFDISGDDILNNTTNYEPCGYK